MDKLTSLQRKLVYLGGIILLSIPVILLGRPASGGSVAEQADSGGVLAKLRIEHQLGENTLGNVDAASSTMNLLLLGFRGIATSMLWMDAQDQQKNKDWAALRGTTESIILLQPHFLKVWHFQGWNLAYNVSAEWDAVADRYYWVKEGIKFFKKGVVRNERYGELYWYTGDTTGKKIGRADEWQQFRRFFRADPDKKNFPSGVDKEINPEGKDNYLVARTWFQAANDVIDNKYHIEQHIMAASLFRQYPTRALIDYALILQREGIFDEVTRSAWEEAFKEWTTVYGKMKFDCPIGFISLEVSDEELEKIRKEDKKEPEPGKRVESWIGRYQDMTNYRFWRTRCKVESEKTMAEAHRELYEGERAYLKADFDSAEKLLISGMEKFEQILKDYPDLESDDGTIEEGMIAQLNWRACLEIDGEEVPETYPLRELWLKNQNRMQSIREEFNRRKRSAR